MNDTLYAVTDHKFCGMVVSITIPESPREHVDIRLGYNENTGGWMVAVASVGFNHVKNNYMVSGSFTQRNVGRHLCEKSHGGLFFVCCLLKNYYIDIEIAIGYISTLL